MMPSSERGKCSPRRTSSQAVILLRRGYRTRRLTVLATIAMVIFIAAFTLPIFPEQMIPQMIIRTVKTLDYYEGHNYEVLRKELQEDIAMDDGTACKMPEIDPFHVDALRLMKQPSKIVCNNTDWVECFLNECYVTQRILDTLKNVTCNYREVYFVTDMRYKVGPLKNFKGGEKISLLATDHVRLHCVGVAEDKSPLAVWMGHKAGFRTLPPLTPPCCGPHVNVLMLCLNSASRSGFIRQMPKSYAALQEMGAVFFKGYNVADGGTSLLPILTGKSEFEFPEIRRGLTDNYINETELIFSPLMKNGYRTAYLEDVHEGTFQRRYNGFKNSPTDHYLRPLLADSYEPDIKNGCLGDTPLHQLVLNLTYQFFMIGGYRFAITFIGGSGFDSEVNKLYAMDDDLANFFQRFQHGGRLSKTALFVMGDHGQRFGLMRETPQGSLEDRLPLMAIVAPGDLKKTRPKGVEAMKANADVLITPFDIHSTLTDMLAFGNLRNRLKVTKTSKSRAMTLLQPIPATRSCGEAGVSSHWCACATWVPVSPEERMFSKVAEVTADFIKNLTSNYR